jgi:hypothetical protein
MRYNRCALSDWRHEADKTKEVLRWLKRMEKLLPMTVCYFRVVVVVDWYQK